MSQGAGWDLCSGQGRLVLLVSCYRFRRRHHRLLPVSAPRCRGGQTAVSRGAQQSIASAAPRHQHRSGPPVRLGDSSSEKGRNPARPLPTSAGPILEQYPGAGPSSDQTTGEGQTGVSRVSRGAANNPRIRGHAHDAEGAGEVGERLGRLVAESVHQQAVRGGRMRYRSRAASVTVCEVATFRGTERIGNRFLPPPLFLHDPGRFEGTQVDSSRLDGCQQTLDVERVRPQTTRRQSVTETRSSGFDSLRLHHCH